ncbi:MAG: hypothetical protein AAGI14_07990 [Pseudomonadota bacterium]
MFGMASKFTIVLKLAVLCLAVAFIGQGTAAACGGKNESVCSWKVFKCDKNYAPNSSDKCVRCGGKGQPACEALRPGKRCTAAYTQKNSNDICEARGGNNQPKLRGIGYDCRPGHNVGSNGKCTKCGGTNQVACEATRPGKQCTVAYNQKNSDGICEPRGGNNQPKLKGIGYDCRPGFNVGSDGKCTTCGGTDQVACEATRPGDRCTAAYTQANSDGICEPRGGEGQPIMSGIGFDCRPGFNWQKDDDGEKICTACGGTGQVACEATRPGTRCTAAYTQANDDRICEPRGGEGQPILSGIGFDCRPGFNWRKNAEGEKYCTACGGENQIGCEATRSGQGFCNEGYEYDLGDKRCYLKPGEYDDPFYVTNYSSSSVYATVHWYATNDELWIMDEAEIAANSTHEFWIAGERTCTTEKYNSGSAYDPSNIVQVIFGDRLRDTCAAQHFQVLFWSDEFDRVKWAVENALVGSVIQIMMEYGGGKAVAKVTNGLIPVPGVSSATDAVSLWLFNVYRDLRDPNGDLAEFGVHAWAYNLPQRKGWVAYWGEDYRPDFGLTTSETPNHEALLHPCERGGFSWATAPNDDGDLVGGIEIPDAGDCDDWEPSSASVPLTVTASYGSRVAQSVSAAPVSLVGSLWMFEIQGNKFYLKVTDQRSNTISVQRANSTEQTTYTRSASGNYVAADGQRLAFTNATTGQWISADGAARYTMSRVN